MSFVPGPLALTGAVQGLVDMERAARVVALFNLLLCIPPLALPQVELSSVRIVGVPSHLLVCDALASVEFVKGHDCSSAVAAVVTALRTTPGGLLGVGCEPFTDGIAALG